MKERNQEYFITLTGAKKNAGDFLITERALKLLNYVAPEFEYRVRASWNELHDIDEVNNSKGIIVLGGPGYGMNIYPGVYKLRKDLNDIQVPVYILGSGWCGRPGDKSSEALYKFTNSGKEFLRMVERTSVGLSCRDYQTLRVLNNNGFNKVTMTGCPAWYDIGSIGKAFSVPTSIDKIVYTPAQDYRYREQSLAVMGYLRERYKNAELIVSFHRGIGTVDEYTSLKDASNTRQLASVAKEMDCKVVDSSYSAKKLDFYDHCDLHVGYRVHGHIYFLSKRLPTVLIHEDGRGKGVTEALGTPGVDAYARSPFSKLLINRQPNYYLAKIYGRLGLRQDKEVIGRLDDVLNTLEETGYSAFVNTAPLLDYYFEVMEQFVRNMIYDHGSGK